MSNFNQFASPRPQHPISAQFNPATSSVQYETTLSPHNSMSQQLNASGPQVFAFPQAPPPPAFVNQYMVPMGPVYPTGQMVQVQRTPTMNMTPPLMLLQSPSPISFVNHYFPQQPQPGYSTPVTIGEFNGQFFPIPVNETLQVVETQSQSSGSSDRPLSGRTSPQPKPVLTPVPVPAPSMRPPPGFPAKAHTPPQQQRRPAPAAAKSMTWSNVIRKKHVVSSKPAAATPKRQTSRAPTRGRKESVRPKVKPERKKRTKFGYRSKQNKIDTVHESLENRYSARGILAEKEEVLRGPDVLRLHVKKFDALTKIEQVLEAAEKIPGVSLKSVSIPLSMKNEFQKKGFLVYCQLSDDQLVEKVKQFFQSHPEFAKCQIAMPNLAHEGEPDYPDLGEAEPKMKPVETGSPEMAPVQKKFMHITPLDGEKDNFSIDDFEEAEGLEFEILPMLKNASLASVGC